jgi:hypothetical protein
MKSDYLRAMCVVFTFTLVFAVASATRELSQDSKCPPELLQKGVSCELLYCGVTTQIVKGKMNIMSCSGCLLDRTPSTWFF